MVVLETIYTAAFKGKECTIFLNFRSLEEVFERIADKRESSQYTVNVSYLEIYKEELRDLLCGGGGGGIGGVAGAGPAELHIRETEGGNTGEG